VRAECARERLPLGRDVERDHSRAHRDGELRRREPDRPLAEDGDRLAALQIEPLQRTVRRAGAAGDRRAGLERERVGQRHQRVYRHLHVLGMRAVAVCAEHGGAFEAHLRPARAAMLAAAAAGVVVIHHALPDARLVRRDAGAERDHDTARLVPGDHRVGAAFESRRGVAWLEARAIDVQVAAAHSRSLDLEHHVARARSRIGKVAQLELAVTDKHDAFHGNPPARALVPVNRSGATQLIAGSRRRQCQRKLPSGCSPATG
jgi:hypothetical protein